MRHVFGWDLPPGVSQRDIDRHFGDDEKTEQCDGCGAEWAESQLDSIEKYSMRVDEQTLCEPSGQCPECGALVFNKEELAAANERTQHNEKG